MADRAIEDAEVERGERAPGVIRGDEAETLLRGPLGADLLAGVERTGGDVAIVVHALERRALGSPVHTHSHEDEYSYVLEGSIGVQVGDTIQVAQVGDLVCKPRGVPHAFWNASDEPARLLEIITPAGFERYFARLAALFADGVPPDPEALGSAAAEFGLRIDPGSVPQLAESHGLVLP